MPEQEPKDEEKTQERRRGPFLGHKHSKQTKERMRAAHRQRNGSDYIDEQVRRDYYTGVTTRATARRLEISTNTVNQSRRRQKLRRLPRSGRRR